MRRGFSGARIKNTRLTAQKALIFAINGENDRAFVLRARAGLPMMRPSKVIGSIRHERHSASARDCRHHIETIDGPRQK